MEASLKVFTLNCWGIRIPLIGSAMVTERMSAIADYVSSKDYDVVVFQEVWSHADYLKLSVKILDKLPYTHYFHGGFLGSGICVFTRYPIVETLSHNYPLNGHAHKIFHGDFYGNKGCGLCVLKVKDMTVHLYSTHMHARYNHTAEFDEYVGHRAAQSVSLSQFVRQTSTSCDGVILTGDFNTNPNELAYRMIRSNAVVNDAWLVKNAEGSHGGGYTCDAPDNCFTPASVTQQLPYGQRIDYIFYRANDLCDIRVDECDVVKEKVPGTQTDISDHFGVQAKMFIKKNITGHQVPELDSGVRQTVIREMITCTEKGCARARYSKYFYFVTMLLCIMVMLMCRERYVGQVGQFLHVILEIIQAVMAVMSGISFWISAYVSKCEQNSYLAQKADLENLLQGATLSKIKKTD